MKKTAAGKWHISIVMLFIFVLLAPALLWAQTYGPDGQHYPTGGNSYGGTGTGTGNNKDNDDNNGGGGGGGSGPPQSEVEGEVKQAINEADGTTDSYKDDGTQAAGEASAALSDSDGSKEAEGNRKENEGEGDQKKADSGGDPVLLTSGQYVFKVDDYEIKDSSINIARKYLSEDRVTGSLGTAWLFAMDSRIMRGWTRVDKEAIEKAEASLAAAAGYSAQIRGEANALMALAQSDVVKPQNKSTTLRAAEAAYDQMMAKADAVDNACQAAMREITRLKAIMERAEVLSALNKYAKFKGSPDYYDVVGNENLVLIDENGIPMVFEPAGTGVWLPLSNPERLYERIETVNKGGADSKAGFILYEKGGRKKHYNGNGMLIAVTELNGNRVDIARDGSEKIAKVSGPHGNEWNFEYSGNLINAIKGPEGTQVQYGYSGDYLAQVKDKEGDTGRYNYSGGRLKEIVKPDGSAIKIDYGNQGAGGSNLVTVTTHEEGSSEKFEYSPSQKATTYTNHSGVITRYFYDSHHRTIREEHSDGRVKALTYNAFGLLYQETLNGFEIRYSYDSRGNVTEKSYSDRKRESWAWNGNDQVTRYSDRDGIVTEWRYDDKGNCVEVRRGGQGIFAASYDGKNRLIASREGERSAFSYEYDSRDFIKNRNVTINGNEIKESWEHDALGRVTKYSDGLGRLWEYTYSAKETIEKTPTGLQRLYEYNNRKDLVKITEKDTKTGEIREQFFKYDKRHLLLEAIDGSGEITKYAYRADGELTRKEQGPWYWEYGYEAGGRISTVTRGKTGTSEKYTENYSYAWQGWNEERAVIKPGAGKTSYVLDPWKRVTAVTNALGEASTRTLNGAGNPLREQASSGGFYAYSYDSLGRPSQAGREGEKTVQVRYNLNGTAAEKTDRVGNVTRYAYEGRGLLAREISALGEERYFYDEAGRVIRRETISRNSTAYRTEWVYNDSQRTVTVTGGGAYTETLYLNAWNEVIRRVDGEGNETRYEYDKAGKIIKAIDGYGRGTSYEWNEIGKLSKTVYTDNTTESYTYNHLGNLKEIKDSLGISWAGEYDEAGRLSKETGRPGINREYKYDSLNRIIEVKAGGEVIEKYSYGNRGREIIFTDGKGNDFTQNKNAFGEFTDENNRLGDSQRYAYDAEGRAVSRTAYSGKQTKIEYRDSEGITITTYSDGTQNIIEHDLLGNIVRASGATGTIRYKYDSGGRLIEQTDEGAGEVTRYSYDKAGRRVRMQSGNRDVIYRYGKNGELLKVNDNSQRLEVTYEYDVRNRETRRVYGNGVRQETLYDAIGRVILIRETDSMGRMLRAEGYLYDSQGRRSHSVDEEGKVTKYEYDNQSRLSVVLYPWTKEKAEADRVEAEEAGLYFTPEKGTGERYSFSGIEQAALRELLNKASPARGNAVAGSQMVWRESYAYDRNGNRATKTTPWGVIKYEYDAENRLLKKGDVVYTNDRDGNTLSEKGLRYEAMYEYNSQNRMVYSQTTSHVEKTHVINTYAYDALGRRTLTESVTGEAIRTLYDGKGFEVIREGEAFMGRSLTTQYAPNGAHENNSSSQPSPSQTSSVAQTLGERYRWVGEGTGSRTRNAAEEGYTVTGGSFGGRGVTLYGKGEAVAVNYSSSTATRAMYLGKDIMGSVRSVTVDTGTLEERYEYDAFGQPYKGDLSTGMNLGYTGKPYNPATGLYNYGYRDYKPQAARFTTVDPIRDGSNWFAYVNNDPVNWVDPWGLSTTDTQIATMPAPTFFTQDQWAGDFGEGFSAEACAATATLNAVSTQYTIETGMGMTQEQGTEAMRAAVDSPAGNISSDDANMNNWGGAANDMWGTTGLEGTWTQNDNDGSYKINAIDRNQDGTPDHFVNDIGNGQYRDTSTGNFGNTRDVTLQTDRPTRGLDFNK